MLWLLGIVVYILILFAWLPVLIYGRQADLVYNIVGGYLRWATRVVCVPAAAVRAVPAVPAELTVSERGAPAHTLADVVSRAGLGLPGPVLISDSPPSPRGGFPSPEAPPP